MAKKKVFKYFVIVNPIDRINQQYMINLLAKLYEDYPHLSDRIEPAVCTHVELGKHVLVRSV